MVFLAEDVAHLTTRGATGNLTFDEALEQLLRDTDLTYRILEPHTAMILPGGRTRGAPVEHRGRPFLLDQFIATPAPVKVWYNIIGSNILRIIAIVDATRAREVSVDQLADYISLVGLAEIKPDAQPGNAPTILRLFADPPEAAPRRLSAWDMAFLQSLYSFEGPWRRGLGTWDRLAFTMTRKVVP